VAALAACLASSSAGADGAKEHVCKEADLTGAYMLASMKETPAGQETAWHQDYRNQYIVFHPDHSYNFVASRHRISDADELHKAIMQSTSDGSAPLDSKYTLNAATGALNLYINDRVDYSYRCMVADKASGNIQAGDLLFTGYSKYNTLLDKIFRHWP
jgi:hypothetical protein